ncbi:MAG: type VI secretion system baseplate subunit TssG [Desulfovibrio sp.]|nr:type VI secretion system baseplate subunit TssG [Desulfovibrio sp.]
MAATARQQKPALIQKLLDRPKAFSFAQALRLLLLEEKARGGDPETFLRLGIAIAPELSLAHSGTDIASLKELPAKEDGVAGSGEEDELEALRRAPRYAMELSFLALYGASSPLPTFYTEELIEEARNDASASRDFLGIFNQLLYVLYYRAYNAYKLGLRTADGDADLEALQCALAGFGLRGLHRGSETPALREAAFAQLFLQSTRTAEGLAAYAAAMSGAPRIEIEQCVERRVSIPADQRARLGQARLGQALAGACARDWTGGIRIHVHDLDRNTLHLFIPGARGRRALDQAVRRYCSAPLAYDVVLHVKDDTPRTAMLGRHELGRNAFLSAPKLPPAAVYRQHVRR